MLAASILLIGALGRNPAFPNPGAGARPIGAAKGVFAITRHPMNWSFILWARVHTSVTGSQRILVVTGGILVLALAGSFGQDRKKERLLGETWRDWQARTSFVPFGAPLSGKTRWRDAFPGWIAIIGGAVLALATLSRPLVSLLGDLLSRGGPHPLPTERGRSAKRNFSSSSARSEPPLTARAPRRSPDPVRLAPHRRPRCPRA